MNGKQERSSRLAADRLRRADQREPLEPQLVVTQVSYRICHEDSAGGDCNRGVGLRDEELARRELELMRAEARKPERWHAHRIEVATTDRRLDW